MRQFVALTRLPHSHSMTTPFESGTDGRVVPSAGTYVNGRRLPLQGRGWGFESLRAYQTKRFLCGVVVQLVRTPACHVGGRGFESRRLRHLFTPRPFTLVPRQESVMTTRPLTKHIAVSVVLCAVAIGVVIALPARVSAQDAEIINLRSWTDQKGRTLADVNQGHSMALVILVSPNCYDCTTQKGSIELLREHAKKAGMGYYVLMTPEPTDTEKYFSFADSLKLDVESFVWSNPEVKAP